MDCRIFSVHTDVNAVAHGGVWKPVCTETTQSLWEKNSFPHQGIEPASAACQSDVLLTELHPHHINFFLILFGHTMTYNVNSDDLHYFTGPLGPYNDIQCEQ